VSGRSKKDVWLNDSRVRSHRGHPVPRKSKQESRRSAIIGTTPAHGNGTGACRDRKGQEGRRARVSREDHEKRRVQLSFPAIIRYLECQANTHLNLSNHTALGVTIRESLISPFENPYLKARRIISRR
jgi:hypothetical protein